MNKKANRRAFFVCIFIGLMYGCIVFGIPEKMKVVRLSKERKIVPSSVVGTGVKTDSDVSLPEVPASILKNETAETVPSQLRAKQGESKQRESERSMTKVDDKSVEPGFLMAPPLVAYAIHEGILEKDGLIFVQKEGYNKSSCKKPIDVLRDKDEQGLRAIARLIGKRQSLEFLRKEGISPSQDLSSEQIISGVGYTIEKEKMLALYTKYVADEFQSMFPFVVQDSAIVKGKKGYELVPARETHGVDRLRTDEHEWTVPNVVNLTMREAVEKLVMHTSRIRVYGNGKVVEQNPRAFERTRGDTECIIYGSTAR